MSNENNNSNILSFQDDFNQDDETFMPESFTKAGVPFLTKYTSLFGKSPFWYVNDAMFVSIRFNHMQLSFLYCVFHLLLLSSFFIWKYVAYDLYFDSLNAYFYYILSLYITLTIGLFRTILTNPGYLPFFYPAQSDRRNFTQTEFRQGFACKKEQVEWARNQKKPHRSTFSERAGYFVIRADHFCAWIQNWVAYKNHRFFLIFVTFSAIYMDTIFLHFVHLLFFHFKSCSIPCHIFTLSLSGFFSFIFSVQTLYQYAHVSVNVTLLESLKRQNRFYDRGCLNNWSEVCGPKKLICLWPFPCITLKGSYNPFNYPEYIGPSYLDDMKKDDKKEGLFNEVDVNNNNENSSHNL